MPAPPNPEVWASTPVGPRLVNPKAAGYKCIFARPPGYGLLLLNNAGTSAPTFGPLPLAQDDNVAAHSTDYTSSTEYSEAASENSQDGSSSPPCTNWDSEAASDSDMTSHGLPASAPSSSRALGVLDPYAAGLFLNVFDEATGVLNSCTAASFQSGYDEAIRARMNNQIVRIVFAPDTVDSYSFAPADDEGDQVEAPIDPFWTEANFRVALTNTIQQMMYVSGETGEPSVETTGIIEDIVRQQVVEIVSGPQNDVGTGRRLITATSSEAALSLRRGAGRAPSPSTT